MPHYQSPRPQRTTRSAVPSAYPYSQYPGLAPLAETAEGVLTAEASALMPYSPQVGAPLAPLGGGVAETATKSGGLLGSLGNLGNIGNLGDIKGIIDRMGGLDGILETVGKVQKVMQTMQQFAPMAKMFTAFLPGAAKLQAGATAAEEASYYKPSRRKRSTRRTGKRSGTGSGSRKKNVKRRR